MKECERVAQNILNNIYIPVSDYTEGVPAKIFPLSERENIEKAHIIESFSRDLIISKNGSEIKEALDKIVQKEQEEIITLLNQMSELKIKIGEEPTVPAEKEQYYTIDGFEDKITDLPMFYPWDFKNMEGDSGYVGDTTPDERNKMRSDYNSIASRFVNCKVEIVMLNTMINNFEDKKSYNLNIRQASILGF